MNAEFGMRNSERKRDRKQKTEGFEFGIGNAECGIHSIWELGLGIETEREENGMYRQ